MRAYSQDLRDRAIKLYLTGNYNKKSLSELLSIGYRTLRYWLKQYDSTGSCKVEKPKNVGRKRLFDDKDAILKYLEVNPDASGKELRNALAPNVCQNCFYNTLNRLGITYKKRGNIQKPLRNKES